MVRWIAGIAAVLLLVTGAVLALQGRAEEPAIPSAPEPRLAAASTRLLADPQRTRGRCQKQGGEALRPGDKDEDGRITLAELVEPRRKAFAKLDVDQDGKLSFEEWAVRTIDKFEEADADKSRSLTPAEYATTAPKPRPKKPACACA